jgi:uncharacterized protein YndB with AHSA1/START domain
MTRQKSFKRLVRQRMGKTGESYTSARAALLAAEEPKASKQRVLATSDEEIRRRTGRGWEEWFDLLDEWGAPERSHREIARWLAEQQDIDPLAWNAQAVANSYELARGLRVVGEHPDGFTITASKTIVPVERLYDAFVDESLRSRWLSDDRLSERTATNGKSARFDWGEGETRVHVTFSAKGEDRSTAALQHIRLADAEEAERMKAFWRSQLATLESRLAGGEIDA